ncbi:MAG: hypothetical protein IPF90_00800 [Actinomycetales bacterium]|jgi:predicted lipoprotein with Yx(FWY)xxD motif|nr:hypothetical protein [Candidatus Phosphoribacter baldrii]
MTLPRSRTAGTFVAIALAAALAGCSGTSTPAPAASAPSSAAPAPAPVLKPAITELKTATTKLGEVVVDGNGMVLYMFTKDTQGTTTSACTGACLAAWPLTVADAAPKLTGVTGAVALIATSDGRKQVTLNGWPLYYFAKDAAAGDVLGQDVNKVWYVLDKSGTPIKP